MNAITKFLKNFKNKTMGCLWKIFMFYVVIAIFSLVAYFFIPKDELEKNKSINNLSRIEKKLQNDIQKHSKNLNKYSDEIHNQENSNKSKFNNIDVEKNIPVTGKNGKNDLAIILGIENYTYMPSVTYAERDAKYMKEYFNKTFGIENNRILYRVNNSCTSAEFMKLESWVKKRIIPNEKTNLYFYYAGHGAPSKNKKAYLLPADADPNYIEDTGVEISLLYEKLSNTGAESVTVFLDACFSGANRQIDNEHEMLLADARPVFIEVEIDKNEKINVFTAAQGNQVSSAWPDKKHGLFSYFLMKGLQGEADTNKNNELTYHELGNYIKRNVSIEAGNLDREQYPTYDFEDKNKILIKYKY